MRIHRVLALSFASVTFFSGSLTVASHEAEERQTGKDKIESKRIVQPEPSDRVLPGYPIAARKARVGGRVLVEITVDETGAVTETKRGHCLEMQG